MSLVSSVSQSSLSRAPVKRLSNSSSVTTLPSLSKTKIEKASQNGLVDKNKPDSPKRPKNRQIQASMDELEKLYDERKQLEVKVELIREEIRKTIETTQKLEAENKKKERQVKTLLEKGSAEQSGLIFQREYKTMEERLGMVTKKYGEVHHATNQLRERVDSLKEDNDRRSQQIAQMTNELDLATQKRDGILAQIEACKTKRHKLHLAIMQLKNRGEAEQREFEEDMRWVRDSDQLADTVDILNSIKQRIKRRYTYQLQQLPLEWVDPENGDSFSMLAPVPEEETQNENPVEQASLSREEMFFVLRDLWKLRDELRMELGMAESRDILDLESVTYGQLQDALNEIKLHYNDLSVLFNEKNENDKKRNKVVVNDKFNEILEESNREELIVEQNGVTDETNLDSVEEKTEESLVQSSPVNYGVAIKRVRNSTSDAPRQNGESENHQIEVSRPSSNSVLKVKENTEVTQTSELELEPTVSVSNQSDFIPDSTQLLGLSLVKSKDFPLEVKLYPANNSDPEESHDYSIDDAVDIIAPGDFVETEIKTENADNVVENEPKTENFDDLETNITTGNVDSEVNIRENEAEGVVKQIDEMIEATDYYESAQSKTCQVEEKSTTEVEPAETIISNNSSLHEENLCVVIESNLEKNVISKNSSEQEEIKPDNLETDICSEHVTLMPENSENIQLDQDEQAPLTPNALEMVSRLESQRL